MPSTNWDSAEFIRDELIRRTSADGTVIASIFLDSSVAESDVDDVVARLVADAGAPSGHLELGRIRSLAKSFSVRGDPGVIAKLIEAHEVKSVLPSAISDIYPKPANIRDID